MTFPEDMKRFVAKVEARQQEVFTGVVDECLRSIQEGSEITGAPGQQVDTGNLRASWQKFYASPTEATIGTNAEYALQEEDGITYLGKPITQHSAVGGPHSTKLTVAGFPAIVEIVTARVTK